MVKSRWSRRLKREFGLAPLRKRINVEQNLVMTYHVSHQGQQCGPYTVEQISVYIGQGLLSTDSLAWNSESNAWVSIAQVPGVVTVATSTEVPPPVATSVSQQPAPARESTWAYVPGSVSQQPTRTETPTTTPTLATSVPEKCTVKLYRDYGYTADRLRRYKIFIDGKKKGVIEEDGDLEFRVDQGDHEIYLRIDWCRSKKIKFNTNGLSEVRFECRPNSTPLTGLFYITLLFSSYIYLGAVTTGITK